MRVLSLAYPGGLNFNNGRKKGPMPHVDSRLTYSLDLNDQEFRLVTLALADLIIDQEDINSCLQLNTKLCAQRAKMTKQAAEVADKALANASEMENPNIPPKKR